LLPLLLLLLLLLMMMMAAAAAAAADAAAAAAAADDDDNDDDDDDGWKRSLNDSHRPVHNSDNFSFFALFSIVNVVMVVVAGEIRSAGSMPLVYFAWLVYSAILAIRVILVYYNFAHKLVDEEILGINTLNVSVLYYSIKDCLFGNICDRRAAELWRPKLEKKEYS
jgi:hypothetical protein